MEPAETLRLSAELNRDLPRAWAGVLQNYPEALRVALRGDGESVAELELSDDVDHLIEMNREVRRDAIMDGDGLVFDWPDSFLVIGEDGGGDYYCIDAEEADPHVMLFDHQLCEFCDLEETVDGFVELLLEQYVVDDEGKQHA